MTEQHDDLADVADVVPEQAPTSSPLDELEGEHAAEGDQLDPDVTDLDDGVDQ